ncbi:MAG: glycoside-pentoside-hexuronide (GPH):cation symporter [Lachnospiraceae bacterium]|jgi:melibiose permease/lactose/raffinose/galactose permease|nr:glycoside-pentoside-hexuronide (GPH):cation symporter [Lachnospiraceae bacterium]
MSGKTAVNTDRRNKYFFGLGTIGRDMFYTMESMFLTYYFTEIMDLPDGTVIALTVVLTVLRIFDAFNDPLMGVIVDNTRSRFGKFKPGMLIGGVIGGVLLVLMFTDMGLSGAAFIIIYALIYLGWDIFYGLNDIAYWSMLPALSTDQKKREEIGSFARICANVGMFAVVVGITGATGALGKALGNEKKGWFVFALLVAVLMMAFMLFTLFGVKENRGYFKQEEKTTLREMFKVLFKNDQLMWVALSMALFMIGYTTTANFGKHFFKYAYGNEDMYSIFALVLGVSQLFALAIFPKISKKMSRKKLYSFATILVGAGYILFFFAPMQIVVIGIAGVLLFIGEAFIQILMLMFLADTIEYGQLKMGKRNESVTFSVQPFINKIGSALSNGVVGVTVVIAGINEAKTVEEVTPSGIVTMKSAMLLLPLVFIGLGYFIYLKKFKIDEKKYAQILDELKARGDIASTTDSVVQ